MGLDVRSQYVAISVRAKCDTDRDRRSEDQLRLVTGSYDSPLFSIAYTAHIIRATITKIFVGYGVMKAEL